MGGYAIWGKMRSKGQSSMSQPDQIWSKKAKLHYIFIALS